MATRQAIPLLCVLYGHCTRPLFYSPWKNHTQYHKGGEQVNPQDVGLIRMDSDMSKQKIITVTRDDCEWQYFTVGGHGGSGKDTSNTGVRVKHPPSGAVGEARESRSQGQNRRAAWRRMAESAAFRAWARTLTTDIKKVTEQVESAMDPKNLKVEVKDKDGRWAETRLSLEDSPPDFGD